MKPSTLIGLVGLLFVLPAMGSKKAEIDQPSVKSALLGQTWQLVEIVSMNDQVDAPEDRSRYTMLFEAEGAARVRADCNRGFGSWTSSAPGQLQFGPIATTKMMCPPGSLSDRYLAELSWVRSYVMRADHLFLATMADGSILEFEPMETSATAAVLGETLQTTDPDELRGVILARLLERYAEQHDITVDDEEVDAVVSKMGEDMRAQGLTAEDALKPDEVEQAAQIRHDMARAMIRQWKINRALYQQYGGRIIAQQLGPEPLDAYKRFLEERQAAGDFSIMDPSLKESFWQLFSDDSRHSFYEEGSEQEARAFTIPFWKQPAANMGSRPQVSDMVSNEATSE